MAGPKRSILSLDLTILFAITSAFCSTVRHFSHQYHMYCQRSLIHELVFEFAKAWTGWVWMPAAAAVIGAFFLERAIPLQTRFVVTIKVVLAMIITTIMSIWSLGSH